MMWKDKAGLQQHCVVLGLAEICAVCCSSRCCFHRSLTRFLCCRALCYLSLKQYKEAVQDCTEALSLDPKNVKALYRRAQALKELKVSQFLDGFSLGLEACACRTGPEMPFRTSFCARQHLPSDN